MNNINSYILSCFLVLNWSGSFAQISQNLGQVGGTGPSYILVKFASALTWSQAQSYGNSNYGSSLAAITSQGVQDLVSNGLANAGMASNENAWTGGNRHGAGIPPNDGTAASFEWVSGASWAFTQWALFQPNNSNDECVILQGNDYKWGDENCFDKYDWAVYAVEVPLPVELLSFEASLIEAKVIRLNWKTATESNNEGFVIEHSKDAKEWKVLDFVNGRGTTMYVQSYTYLHKRPKVGVNYYRLKQIDFDGTPSFSNIISVHFQAEAQKVRLFPNPTNGQLNIDLEKEGAFQISILNAQQVIFKIFTKINEQTVSLDLADLQPGWYLISISGGERTLLKSFVKY